LVRVPFLSIYESHRLRLHPDGPRSFPANREELTESWKTADAPIRIGAFPCGLYGTLRDLMGVEGSLIAFYGEPEPVKTITDDLTDFRLRIFEIITRDVQVDMIHIWEDMSGKQGSLISPAFICEFMLPNYKRIRDFADAHGIPIMVVDTDGNCEELIPLFHEAG
jgi:uroporphyrinogen decarboxylase